MEYSIKELGISESQEKEALLFEDIYIGRVVSQSQDLYQVATESGRVLGKVTGKFKYHIGSIKDYPAVGDFILLDRDTNQHGNAMIHKVLKRKSVMVRKAAGKTGEVQVIAANIDIVFICMSLNQDFNLRRMERYLSVVWDSGAKPVIVLTKADLSKDIEAKLSEVESVAIGVDILITSAVEKDGYESILKYITKAKTIAFIGSSGVGKSTLINLLLGNQILATNGLRNDDKGRHTTTRRELMVLPNGGIVIDTPGMREIGVESEDFSNSFSDIEQLALECRFRNCTHQGEPGCAVAKAVENGILSKERLENYFKLEKEAQYNQLNAKQIEREKMNHMFAEFDGVKNAKKFVKSHRKNK